MTCPINFGDCPDCEYYVGGGCEYEQDKRWKH